MFAAVYRPRNLEAEDLPADRDAALAETDAARPDSVDLAKHSNTAESQAKSV